MIVTMPRKRLIRIAFLALATLLLTACQPMPTGSAVVGRGGEALEQKPAAPPLAPYVYEAPAAVNDIIQMNICRFVGKGDMCIRCPRLGHLATLELAGREAKCHEPVEKQGFLTG